MLGRLYVSIGLLLIVLPILVASFLQDVTRRQMIVICIVAAVVDFGFLASQSERLRQIEWDLRAPSPAPAEIQFIRLLAAPPESGSCVQFVNPEMWTGIVDNIVRTLQGNPLLSVRISPSLVLYQSFSKTTAGASPADRSNPTPTLSIKDAVRFSAVLSRTSQNCIQVNAYGGGDMSVPARFTNIGRSPG